MHVCPLTRQGHGPKLAKKGCRNLNLGISGGGIQTESRNRSNRDTNEGLCLQHLMRSMQGQSEHCNNVLLFLLQSPSTTYAFVDLLSHACICMFKGPFLGERVCLRGTLSRLAHESHCRSTHDTSFRGKHSFGLPMYTCLQYILPGGGMQLHAFSCFS